jgi:hypothetical protein
MTDQMIAETDEKLYNDLREEPCIVCGDPYLYVLGSYTPDAPKRSVKHDGKAPVLYYTLCEKCFNKGRIPTARIEAAYRHKFGKAAA